MSRSMKMTGLADLIAAIPRVMGFVPHESFLVVPIGASGRWARVNHPSEPEDFAEAARALTRPFLRDHLDVGVVSFTKNRAAAEGTCNELTRLMGRHVRVAAVLWVDGETWTDMATADTAAADASAAPGRPPRTTSPDLAPHALSVSHRKFRRSRVRSVLKPRLERDAGQAHERTCRRHRARVGGA